MKHAVNRFASIALLFFALLLPASHVAAEQFSEVGDYIIHYNAITTDILSPEIASTYDIRRSKSQAMLNIAVLKKTDDGLGEPVEADIEVLAANLNGQQKAVSVRLVSEQNARYYIGQLGIAHMETLRFNLSVKPSGSDETFEVTFSQQFYVD